MLSNVDVRDFHSHDCDHFFFILPSLEVICCQIQFVVILQDNHSMMNDKGTVSSGR